MALRIVFMGTPEFAVPSLDILYTNGYDIAGVVTATDKLGGRGKSKLIVSAVKEYALDKGIPVLQPPNLKKPGFVEQLRALDAELQVVVAFRMLPEVVWSMPPMGTMNLHGSLLPKYRGAAPINWAIMNGEQETGVTTFMLKHAIDTGDILIQRTMPIGRDETAGELHDRMMHVGAEVVLESVRGIESGLLKPKPQPAEAISKAPKLDREMCRIDFNNTTQEVYNKIRGLSPYPGAWTVVDGKEVKILLSAVVPEPHGEPPGTILTTKNTMLITCKDGSLSVLELKMEGKKRMAVSAFLNGYTVRSRSVARE